MLLRFPQVSNSQMKNSVNSNKNFVRQQSTKKFWKKKFGNTKSMF